MKTNLSRLITALSPVLLVAFCAVAEARPPGVNLDQAFPTVNLARHTHGEEAITALDAQLPEVARAYGKSEPEFKGWLRRERTLQLDPHGRLYYADEVPPPPADASGITNTTVGAPVFYALEDTFRLHSLSGAHKIIYLDFNGRTLSGTAWNAGFTAGADIVCPPFDFEGGPLVFTDNERLRIQAIWQRVAEDYAPFDVDVTTEDPGDAALTRSDATDQDYGVRVLVSPASSYFGNYGGISYVGTFDNIGDYYKPSLVFTDKLGNTEKYIAEACSHEAGHALGLSHEGTTAGVEYYCGQGSGDTGWAPIMGNSYYRNVTQWSRGEYPLANNPEDQLAILASYLPYRAAERAADRANATLLPTGTGINALGLIGGNSADEVFAFWTGSGAITLNLTPAALGPDLDILAELFDASGTLVATSNPTATLGAGFSGTLPAGKYYLRVQGTGCGDMTTGYSCYGSLGQYTLTGTLVDASGSVPPVAVATASVTSGYAPLTVQLDGSQSSDLDGTITGWYWNFGDGQTSSQPSPSHIYSAAGAFPVTLTVTDNDGLASADRLTITVTFPNLPPNAVASATPTSGTAPLTVAMSAAGSSDLDGSIVSYAWNFGDGATGSGAPVSHLYQTDGNYTATLTVTDNRGATSIAQASISVTPGNKSPVAVASATPISGTVPLTVTLSAAGSADSDGSIASYAWNFGDGTTGSKASVQHIYQAVGSYVAVLTVLDNRGATGTAQVNISVAAVNKPPVAVASAAPTAGTVPLTVTLSAAGSTDPDGSIVSYAWKFGDGATGSGVSVQHIFQAAGTYATVLTVTDNRGATSTAQVTIQVQPVLTTMFVQTIALQVVTTAGKKTVRATVRVTTTAGQAVSGATVAGAWSGVITGTSSGKTGATGAVVLTSAQVRKSGLVTFGITKLTKTGSTYDATKNLVSSLSIAVP